MNQKFKSRKSPKERPVEAQQWGGTGRSRLTKSKGQTESLTLYLQGTTTRQQPWFTRKHWGCHECRLYSLPVGPGLDAVPVRFCSAHLWNVANVPQGDQFPAMLLVFTTLSLLKEFQDPKKLHKNTHSFGWQLRSIAAEAEFCEPAGCVTAYWHQWSS